MNIKVRTNISSEFQDIEIYGVLQNNIFNKYTANRSNNHKCTDIRKERSCRNRAKWIIRRKRRTQVKIKYIF